MDHKIWSETIDSHESRHSDAAFHLYARVNVTSVWQSSNGEQHLLKLDVRFFLRNFSSSCET